MLELNIYIQWVFFLYEGLRKRPTFFDQLYR